MRLLLGCLASALMLGSASAQSLPLGPTQVTSLDWATGTWGGGSVTRVLSGDFNHDLYRDLVLLDDGDLIQAFGPAVFEFFSPLNEGVAIVDACVVPAATTGGFDGIVASDSSGWRTIWIDYSGCTTNPPHGSSCDHVSTTGHSNTTWKNARSLQTLKGSSGTPRVVAICENGDHLLQIKDPFGSFDASVVLTLPAEGLALASVNWDGTGLPEVAVLHKQGVSVYQLDFASSPYYDEVFSNSLTGLTPLQGGCLVGFRQDSSAQERLAVVVRPASGNAQLQVFDNIEDFEDRIDLALLIDDDPHIIASPYALAAGDIDGDQADEIVVAHQDGSLEGPVVYDNLCSGWAANCDTFDESGAWVADLNLTTYSGQVANPVLADFTSDGDVDLAWFQQSQDDLLLAENLTVDRTTQHVNVILTQDAVGWDDQELTSVLSVKFQDPGTTAEFTFEPTHILVEQWYEGSDPLTLDPVGVQAKRIDWPLNSTQWNARKTLFLWPDFVPLSGYLHLTVRAAHFESGVLVAAGPVSIHSVVRGGDDAKAALESHLFPQSGTQVVGFPATKVPLNAYPGTQPKVYDEGPHPGNNASMGGGGGKPPRPPPGGVVDPPVTPIAL